MAAFDVATATAQENIDESQEAPKTMSSHLRPYRAGYVRGAHNGDEIAKALDGASLDTMVLVAIAVLGKDTTTAKMAKYEGLNNGQKRMCLGNMVRNATKKDPSLLATIRKVAGAK